MSDKDWKDIRDLIDHVGCSASFGFWQNSWLAFFFMWYMLSRLTSKEANVP